MKKIMLAGIIIYASLIVVWYAQMIVPDSTNYILTESEEEILRSDDINDPLRDGAYTIIQSWDSANALDVVSADEKITNYQNAQTKTINVIKSIINYALWMLGLVALVYLIYHGFLILTASGDDTQYKKGLKGLKFAAIAIAGIGASWIIVSGIFRLIALIIW